MSRDKLVVDYCSGHFGSQLTDQKWFDGWYSILERHLSPKFLFTRRRYLPNRYMGAAINAYLRSVSILRQRRKNGILHIPTQLLCEVVANRKLGHGPIVVTCHDVISYLPNHYDLTGERYPKKVLDKQILALQRADAVLTDSQHARRDIAEILGVDLARIHVVLHGVDADHYRPLGRNKAVMDRYGFAIDRPNLLYVGSEAPRKNIAGIIRAMVILREKGTPVRLIKVGSVHESWGAQHRALVREFGLVGDVVCHQNVPESTLPYLYSAADAFVFPSFYEGFGLPVLEAMASGCPVVTSTSSSLPEVAGEAALLVDPSRPDAIANGIEQLLTLEGLRHDLIRKGIEQARRFPWQRTADEIMAVYDKLLLGAHASQ